MSIVLGNASEKKGYTVLPLNVLYNGNKVVKMICNGVEVWNLMRDITSLITNKSAPETSIYVFSHLFDGVIDNDLNHEWATTTNPATMDFTFSKKVNIRKIKYWNSTVDANGRVTELTVKAYVNDEWVTVATLNNFVVDENIKDFANSYVSDKWQVIAKNVGQGSGYVGGVEMQLWGT